MDLTVSLFDSEVDMKAEVRGTDDGVSVLNLVKLHRSDTARN